MNISGTIVGKTLEGVPIIAGLGDLYFQEGIPLSVIFDAMKRQNMQPSFFYLYKELKTNGMTHDRIIHLFNEHVFESYGKEYRDKLLIRLETVKEFL